MNMSKEFLPVSFQGREVFVRKAVVWFVEMTKIEVDSGIVFNGWAVGLRSGGVAFHSGGMTYLLTELGSENFLRLRGPGMTFIRKAFIDSVEFSPKDDAKDGDFSAVGLYPGPRQAAGLLPGTEPFVYHGTMEDFWEDMARGVPIFTVSHACNGAQKGQ